MAAQALPIGANAEAHCVELIRATLNPDPHVRSPAEEALKQSETSSGFCTLLLQIGTNQAAYDTTTRTLATIVLKNIIHRQWNAGRRGGVSSSNGGISVEEKHALRQRLLALASMCEPSKQVATQLRVIIAKVARADWPNAWPDLFDTLVQYVQKWDENVLLVRRSTYVLYSAIKELSTKKLLSGKKNFMRLTEQLFGGIKSLWTFYAKRFCDLDLSKGGENETAQAAIHAELLLRYTKMMRLLLVCGFGSFQAHRQTLLESFEQLEMLQRFLKSSLRNNKNGLMKVSEGAHGDVASVGVTVRKLLKSIVRCVVDLQKAKPLDFLPFLSQFLQRFYENVTAYTEEERDSAWIILSVTFIANVIDCKDYRQEAVSTVTHSAQSKNGPGKLITASGDARIESAAVFSDANKQINAFFTVERLRELCRHLICKPFCITTLELEQWNDDPEEFVMVQEFLTKEERLRPASENLLMSLIDRYEDVICTTLVEALEQHEKQFPPDVLLSPSFLAGLEPASQRGCFFCGLNNPCKCPEALASPLPRCVVVRDGVYLALGLVAYWMYKKLSFERWLQHSLVPLLSIPKNSLAENNKAAWSYRVLQRRALWLIRCWVSELPKQMRPPLFNALVALVESEAELGVKIAAVNSLKALVDDWDFDPDAFQEYQTRSISAIYALIYRCQTTESRLMLLQTVIKIAECAEARIVSSLQQLLSPIPQMWDTSLDSEEGLWRTALLNLLDTVVQGCGFEHESAQALLPPIVIPLILYSTDSHNKDQVYLCEDATKLWAAVMKSIPSFSPVLLEAFLRLPGIVAEVMCEEAQLNVVLQIVECYVLLGGDALLKSPSHVDTMRQVLCAIIGKTKPEGEEYGNRALELIITKFPEQSPLILDELICSLLVVCCTDERKTIPATVLVGHLTILVRTFVQNQAAFMGLLNRTASGIGKDAGELFYELVRQWISMFPEVKSVMVGPWRRKLWSMGLCTSLTMNHEAILQNCVASILSVCMKVYEELGDDKGAALALQRYDFGGRNSAVNYFTLKRNLFLNDPIVQTDILGLLNDSLLRCQQAIGEDNFQQFVAYKSAAYDKVVKVIQGQRG